MNLNSNLIGQASGHAQSARKTFLSGRVLSSVRHFHLTLLASSPFECRSAFLSLSFLFPLLYFLLAPLPIGQKKPQLTARRLHFVVVYVQFPEDYPSSAPQIQFLTTNGGKTRFNPNLYADGKVCLSILGTWRGESGEQWSSVQNCQVFTPIFSSLLHLLFPRKGLQRIWLARKGNLSMATL